MERKFRDSNGLHLEENTDRIFCKNLIGIHTGIKCGGSRLKDIEENFVEEVIGHLSASNLIGEGHFTCSGEIVIYKESDVFYKFPDRLYYDYLSTNPVDCFAEYFADIIMNGFQPYFVDCKNWMTNRRIIESHSLNVYFFINKIFPFYIVANDQETDDFVYVQSLDKIVFDEKCEHPLKSGMFGRMIKWDESKFLRIDKITSAELDIIGGADGKD